jgi:hypothetical protein
VNAFDIPGKEVRRDHHLTEPQPFRHLTHRPSKCFVVADMDRPGMQGVDKFVEQPEY